MHAVATEAEVQELTPVPHAVHDEAIAALYMPFPQAEHVDDVPPVEKVFEVHAVQTPLFKAYPALQDVTDDDVHVEAAVLLVVPPAQAVHDVAVPPAEYVLLVQAVQTPFTSL